eukprot:TRINITY_DN1687_c0_g1_i4.p1 TRINITY_DN1687_c0_g1~~TRINITY_DN1687_c0_g1_i4.p1  ORF type:complete len:300 (+),score=41.07 TRINITY_DN1687_c0_g1_i4:2016-2915(+)
MLEFLVLFFLRTVVWYYHITAWSLWTLLLLPLVEWIYSVNTFHDASHSAISCSPLVNMLSSYSTFFPISTSVWFVQHIISHHPYTNVLYHDPDLGRPPQHNSIKNKKAVYTPAWVFIMWPLTLTLLGFFLNIEAYVTRLFNAIAYAPPPFHGYYRHFIGRAIMFFIWIGWAFLFAPTWLYAFLWGLIPLPIYTLCFMVSTQLTHMNDDAMKELPKDWYKHQVEAAVNFSLGFYPVTLFTGGLNYQIEHHIYPTVNHSHLPHLQPGVQKICAKHGVEYKVNATMSEGLPAYYNFMTKDRI